MESNITEATLKQAIPIRILAFKKLVRCLADDFAADDFTLRWCYWACISKRMAVAMKLDAKDMASMEVNLRNARQLDVKMDLKLPRIIVAALLDHQLSALEFFWECHLHRSGSLLGDTMGLGKTVTLLVYLSSLYYNGAIPIPNLPATSLINGELFDELVRKSSDIGDDILPLPDIDELTESVGQMVDSLKGIEENDIVCNGPILLVCPATLEMHWKRNTNIWLPFVRVVLYRKMMKYLDPTEIQEFVKGENLFVIASYEMVARHKKLFKSIQWAYVVADEGHRLKNPDTLTSKALRGVRTVGMKILNNGEVSGGHRLLLTGTPIQNNLDELWAVMDYIKPTLLGTREAFANLAEPIYKGTQIGSSYMDKLVAENCLKSIQRMINTYILRRTREEVGDISLLDAEAKGDYDLTVESYDETILLCPLTWAQYEAYITALDDGTVSAIYKHKMSMTVNRALTKKLGRERSTRQIRSELSTNLKNKAFVLMSRLKTICMHPLMDHAYRASLIDEVDTETNPLAWLASKERYEAALLRKFDTNIADSSSKIKVLFHMIERWKEERSKCIVFSSSSRLIHILNLCLGDIGEYPVALIDGSTSMTKRNDIVDAFQGNNDELMCLIMTTRVGGVGLDLTAANNVVIFDPDWNPQVDNQAKQRACRVGQVHKVRIYRLISEESIDEVILCRQFEKVSLSEAILGEWNGASRSPSTKHFDLLELFKEPRPPDSPIPTGMTEHARFTANRSMKHHRRTDEIKEELFGAKFYERGVYLNEAGQCTPDEEGEINEEEICENFTVKKEESDVVGLASVAESHTQGGGCDRGIDSENNVSSNDGGGGQYKPDSDMHIIKPEEDPTAPLLSVFQSTTPLYVSGGVGGSGESNSRSTEGGFIAGLLAGCSISVTAHSATSTKTAIKELMPRARELAQQAIDSLTESVEMEIPTAQNILDYVQTVLPKIHDRTISKHRKPTLRSWQPLAKSIINLFGPPTYSLTSANVVAKFNGMWRTNPPPKNLIKEMLKLMCDKESNNGSATWILKNEFRKIKNKNKNKHLNRAGHVPAESSTSHNRRRTTQSTNGISELGSTKRVKLEPMVIDVEDASNSDEEWK